MSRWMSIPVYAFCMSFRDAKLEKRIHIGLQEFSYFSKKSFLLFLDQKNYTRSD